MRKSIYFYFFTFRCGSDGRMKCDPKVCSPEPHVQQAFAESE